MNMKFSPPPVPPLEPVLKPSLSTNVRHGAMLFRIVGPHLHQAVLGDRVFLCTRESTATDVGLSVRWLAFEGQTRLDAECRTLNAAKKLCRIAANDAAGGTPR